LPAIFKTAAARNIKTNGSFVRPKDGMGIRAAASIKGEKIGEAGKTLTS
jgi:hypothetical protein